MFRFLSIVQNTLSVILVQTTLQQYHSTSSMGCHILRSFQHNANYLLNLKISHVNGSNNFLRNMVIKWVNDQLTWKVCNGVNTTMVVWYQEPIWQLILLHQIGCRRVPRQLLSHSHESKIWWKLGQQIARVIFSQGPWMEKWSRVNVETMTPTLKPLMFDCIRTIFPLQTLVVQKRSGLVNTSDGEDLPDRVNYTHCKWFEAL